jgi:hypothetical protein
MYCIILSPSSTLTLTYYIINYNIYSSFKPTHQSHRELTKFTLQVFPSLPHANTAGNLNHRGLGKGGKHTKSAFDPLTSQLEG